MDSSQVQQRAFIHMLGMGCRENVDMLCVARSSLICSSTYGELHAGEPKAKFGISADHQQATSGL